MNLDIDNGPMNRFKTTHPDNSLRAIVGGEFKTIFPGKEDFDALLEDVQRDHSQRYTIPINGNQTTFSMPKTIPLVNQVMIRAVLKTALPVDSTGNRDPRYYTGYGDFWLLRQIVRLQIRCGGTDWQDHDINVLIEQARNCSEYEEVVKMYEKLCGEKFAYYRDGDVLGFFLPVHEVNLRKGTHEKKPFPMYLLASGLDVTIDWVDASIFKQLDVVYFTSELYSSTQYKMDSIDIPQTQYYSFQGTTTDPTFSLTIPTTPATLRKASDILVPSTSTKRSVDLKLKAGDTKSLIIKPIIQSKASSSYKLGTTVLPLNAFQRDEGYISSTELPWVNRLGTQISDIELKITGTTVYKSEKEQGAFIHFLEQEGIKYHENYNRDQITLTMPMGLAVPSGGVAEIHHLSRKILNPENTSVVPPVKNRRIRNDCSPLGPLTNVLIGAVPKNQEYVGLVCTTAPSGGPPPTGGIYKLVKGYFSHNRSVLQQDDLIVEKDLLTGITQTEAEAICQYTGIFGTTIPLTLSQGHYYLFAPYKPKANSYYLNLSAVFNKFNEYASGVDFQTFATELTYTVTSEEDPDPMCQLANMLASYRTFICQELYGNLKVSLGTVKLIH